MNQLPGFHLLCLFQHNWECTSQNSAGNGYRGFCKRCGEQTDDIFKGRDERFYDKYGSDLAEASFWTIDSDWYWLHRCDRCRRRFLHERFYEVFPDWKKDLDHGWWWECSHCLPITLTRRVEKAARDGEYPRIPYTETEVRTNGVSSSNIFCEDRCPLHGIHTCILPADHSSLHEDRSGWCWK